MKTINEFITEQHKVLKHLQISVDNPRILLENALPMKVEIRSLERIIELAEIQKQFQETMLPNIT